MLLHDSVARAEAEASSLPDGLGCVKGLENVFRVLDAGTGVRELNQQLRTDGSERDIQGAAGFFQSVGGVGEQLQKNMEKLAGVTLNRGAVFLGAQVHAETREFGDATQLDGALEKRLEVGRGKVDGRFLRETQHVRHQIVGTKG